MTLDAADACAKKLLFEGDRQRIVPKNEAELDEHCKVMTENMKCLEKHSKCYRPFPRQVFNMVLVHVKSAVRGRCMSKPGRDEFMYHMKCVQSPEKSEPAHVCIDQWTVMMKLVSDTFAIEDHFPGVCCSFHIMRDCLVSAVSNSCQNTTSAETAEYTRRKITETFSDFLDLACGKQKNRQECDVTFKDGTGKLLKAIENGVPVQNGSALFHALKIVTRHD